MSTYVFAGATTCGHNIDEYCMLHHQQRFYHTVVTGGPSFSNAKTKPEEEEVKFPWSRNPGHDNVVTPAQRETRKLEVVDEEEFDIPPLFVAKSRFGRRRSGREHTPVYA
ncbi:hypothetical protein IGI04_019824 [Brassica rapa subsp. trilocularis]|uniref:Uncharacterized protein n=1 Tax=Brassica rapa subsp. trilocularis TaxID=1813537 RepID=A0ABQ7MGY3_BRACM|nr:hypothetical protein IGI04_019824 [Brassica rapa subsp. trilocularis]